jgi:hypothetical protein
MNTDKVAVFATVWHLAAVLAGVSGLMTSLVPTLG